MPTVTLLTDARHAVEVRLDGGHVLVRTDELAAATGWELKPEGLCQGEICVPVLDRETLVEDGHVDLAALAGTVGAPVAIDTEQRVAAIGQRPADVGARLRALEARDLTLPDLNGNPMALSAFGGRKRLLVAFASW